MRAFVEDLEKRLARAAAGDGEVVVAGPEAHHLGRVRRARAGDRVLLFDGAGLARWAEVERVGRREVALRPLDGAVPAPVEVRPVTVCVAPPKGKRMRWLLEKLTELAVTGLVPLATERGVVDPAARKEHKQGKWRQATVEAAKQCGLLVLPEIAEPCGLEEALARPERLRVLLDPEAPRGLGEVLAAAADGAAVLALVGPEGGFTADEQELARSRGAVPVRLAPTVLRVETAAIALLAAIRASDVRGAGRP